MRPVHQQAGVNRLLARFFGIKRRPAPAHRHRRRAAAARDHAHAGRGGIDVDAAGHLERLQERTQAALVGSFHDHVHRVLALHDRFAVDLQPESPDVRAAQMVEKAGTQKRVLRRTAFDRMLMSYDEKTHVDSSLQARRSYFFFGSLNDRSTWSFTSVETG